MNSSRPLHQRAITALVVGAGVVLAAGNVLGAISNANALISRPLTYVGTALLLLGVPAVHCVLRAFPLMWIINGQSTRITGFGVNSLAVTFGLIVLLWLPRAAEQMRPADRVAINWAELLWSGKQMTVDTGELPDHARGSLLVDGRSYVVWWQEEPCLWQSYGPALLPKSLARVVAEHHYNQAGPSIGEAAHLNRTDSATATSDCNSPREGKMVVLGLPVDLDRRGNISFGGSQHRIGALRKPKHWAWFW